MFSNYIEIIEAVNHPLLELEFIKQYLRISHDYEDAILLQTINAAIECAEHFLGFYLNLRKIKTTINSTGREFTLKFQPIDKILSLTTASEDTELQVDIDYRLNKSRNHIELQEKYLNTDLKVEYLAGFNENTLPASIKQGLLVHISELYERERSDGSLSNNVMQLYMPFRKRRL